MNKRLKAEHDNVSSLSYDELILASYEAALLFDELEKRLIASFTAPTPTTCPGTYWRGDAKRKSCNSNVLRYMGPGEEKKKICHNCYRKLKRGLKEKKAE